MGSQGAGKNRRKYTDREQENGFMEKCFLCQLLSVHGLGTVNEVEHQLGFNKFTPMAAPFDVNRNLEAIESQKAFLLSQLHKPLQIQGCAAQT